jgi:hypothetical protein
MTLPVGTLVMLVRLQAPKQWANGRLGTVTDPLGRRRAPAGWIVGYGVELAAAAPCGARSWYVAPDKLIPIALPPNAETTDEDVFEPAAERVPA